MSVAARISWLDPNRGSGIGVDVYPWPGVNLVVENSAQLPFDDRSFETATIIAASNHVSNRKDVLKEVYRILKPGGTITVTMRSPSKFSAIWHFISHAVGNSQVIGSLLPLPGNAARDNAVRTRAARRPSKQRQRQHQQDIG